MQDNFETRDERNSNREPNPIQPRRRPRKKKKNTAKLVWTAAVVALSLILVVLSIVAVAVDMLSNLGGPAEFPQSSASGSTTEDPATTGPSMPSTPADPLDPNAVINVMLLGTDEDGYRTDTMMLCTIHVAKKTVTLTSFMRDLWVHIPAKGSAGKLNSAWGRGGFDSLRDTIEHNFGLRVDDYFLVNFSSFKTIIDLLGGVDIELSQKEVTYFKEVTYHGDGLVVGMNRLNGEQALSYARMRKPDGDFQRTDRQRKVLEAIFKAYKDKGLGALGLVDDILPHLYTNMETKDIWYLAREMLPMLSGFQIVKKCIPDAYYTGENGVPMYESKNDVGSNLIVDLEVAREYLEKILNP